MPARFKKRHYLVLSSIGLLLSFQNCSQTPSDNGLNSASSYQQSLPFAYDQRIDTLAYMSCSEIAVPVEPRAYFSFRASAYTPMSSGITLTQKFRDATAYYTTTDRARAFAESDLNTNTRLTLSIRSASNYQSVWQTEQVSPGEAVDSFLPPLDSNEIAGPLAAVPVNTRLNYFPGTNDQRLMEASLRYFKLEDDANRTRLNLDSSAGILVTGFSNSADLMDLQLRSPTDTAAANGTPPPAGTTNQTSVFGRGYQFNFALPIGMQAGDRRVLSSAGIHEIDLTNKQYLSSNWDCSTNYQFIVVRPEDQKARKVICDAGVDRYTDDNQRVALDAIRRVLRPEDWYVDMNHHCVMPHTGDYCYGATLGTRDIQYGSATCLDDATHECPHFVSVCIRN